MAECLVLGAGMVGVSTALALQAQGHAVRIIDRHAPGRETSFGNAGVIQSEAHEPYAMPRDLATLWRMATGQSNDVRIDWAALPGRRGRCGGIFAIPRRPGIGRSRRSIRN